MRVASVIGIARRSILVVLVIGLSTAAGLQLRVFNSSRIPTTQGVATEAATGAAGPSGDPFEGISLPRLDQHSLKAENSSLTEKPGASAGTKRIVSEEGGWSVEIPIDWTSAASHLRGGTLSSGIQNGPNYPPPEGVVSIWIAIWPDHDERGPVWHADHPAQPYPGTSPERAQVTIGGLLAEYVLLRELHPNPTNSLAVARWYLQHPGFDDRLVQIVVRRAEGSILLDAQRVVESLRLFEPAYGPHFPLLSREEAVARVTARQATGAASDSRTHIEARLVLNKEWELARSGSRSFTVDPNTPVWLVLERGDFEFSGRGGPAGFGVDTEGRPLPPPRWTWKFSAFDARTGFGFAGGGGTSGTEPTWWPLLLDRSP